MDCKEILAAPLFLTQNCIRVLIPVYQIYIPWDSLLFGYDVKMYL